MKNDEKKKKQLDFYRCSVCGNLIIKLNDSGIIPQCCGRDMERLEPNSIDASTEYHVPKIMMDGNKLHVFVGNEPHPMTSTHHIQWIVVKTCFGIYLKELKPEDEPMAIFKLCKDEDVQCVYCYCNLHGLWKGKCAKDDKDCKDSEDCEDSEDFENCEDSGDC